MRAHTKENDLSLELKKAILEAFWISELRESNILGPYILLTFALQ